MHRPPPSFSLFSSTWRVVSPHSWLPSLESASFSLLFAFLLLAHPLNLHVEEGSAPLAKATATDEATKASSLPASASGSHRLETVARSSQTDVLRNGPLDHGAAISVTRSSSVASPF